MTRLRLATITHRRHPPCRNDRACDVMAGMADRVQADLGAVQQTLFIPLAARARERRKRRPVLRDPKAAQVLSAVDFDTRKYGAGAGGGVTVLRTAIFDCWVSDFLT